MSDTITIETGCGKITGINEKEYTEYRGIRYAKAERWQYPVPVDTWQGTYDATQYGSCSYQRRSFEEDAVCSQFYHHEFREGLSFTYSEDCQYLNLYVPKNAVGCPVLIYIHGGSFTGGSANEAHISGSEMARHGILFAAMNYRLGPYGFCSHPDLKDAQGRIGNYGLYDQYEAIAWIRRHIADFGGDPSKITLMGQSAGAMSVDIHSTSPLEKNWFQGLMLSSGAALQRYWMKPKQAEDTRTFWNTVCMHAKCSDMQELRKADVKTLYYAWDQTRKETKHSMACTLPVYDGQILTPETFNMHTMPQVPVMAGITINDMSPMILLWYGVMKWCHALPKGVPCYTYLFARQLPGDAMGAWHASDLLYFFSTYQNNWRPYTKEDISLSHMMRDTLINFTKKQDPNGDSVPVWHADIRHPMRFDTVSGQTSWHVGKLIHNTLHKGQKEF